jgi:hypothetical protein
VRVLGLIKRIKLGLPRRRKAERQMPVLSWQELDEDDERELLEQVKADGDQEVIDLQNAMRGPN